MSILKRGGKYYIDVDMETSTGERVRVRKKSPINTKRAAIKFEAQVRAEVLNGSYQKKKKKSREQTLSFFSNGYMMAHVFPTHKPSGFKGKREILDRHILPVLGHMEMGKITAKDIAEFKTKKLNEGLSPKTVQNIVWVLSNMFTVAADWGVIEESQRPKIKALKTPQPGFKFLTTMQADRFVIAAEPGMWKALFATGLRTGARIGELLELRWSDINFEAGVVVISRSITRGVISTPKSNKSRSIPLNYGLLKLLEKYKHDKSELVFCDETGRHLTPGKLRRPIRLTCEHARVPIHTPHVWRHSFASHLAMANVPIPVIQQLLGHSSITETMRYAHLSPDAKTKAVNVLDDGAITAQDE